MTVSDWINSTVAVATVLMAGGTFYLAYVTQKLAKSTAEGAKQAERHHQENLRPFCIVVFPGASEQQPFGPEFHSQLERLSSARAGAADQIRRPERIWVRGNVHNKGKGAAKDVLLYFNMRRGEGDVGAIRLTRPVVASGLIGAEETLAIDIAVTERDVMHIWDGTGWKPTQVFSAIANGVYEIVLEYRDIFGNIFRTVHPRGIWTNPMPDIADQEKKLKMLIRQDRPTPLFLTGRQPVDSPADLPCLPQEPVPDKPGRRA